MNSLRGERGRRGTAAMRASVTAMNRSASIAHLSPQVFTQEC